MFQTVQTLSTAKEEPFIKAMLTSYITQANVYHYFTVVINCLIAEDTKENTNVADMDDMIKKKNLLESKGYSRYDLKSQENYPLLPL